MRIRILLESSVKKKHILKKISQEHFALAFKALIAFTIYVFVVEPFLFEFVIRKGVFNFVNHSTAVKVLYSLYVFFACAICGYVYGNIKGSLITLLDITVIAIVFYTSYLSLFRYQLYPEGCWIRLGLMPLGIPVLSAWLFWNRNIKRKSSGLRGPEPYNNGEEISIIPDLSLSDLEKHTGVPKKTLDAQTLEYYPLAEVIFDAITKIEPKRKAFSIGLNGTWGSGKSSLIDLIKDLAQEYSIKATSKKEIKIIDFSPWIYPDENSLVKNFLIQLKTGVNSQPLQSLIDHYSLLLTNVDVGGFNFNLNELFSESKNLAETKGDIAKDLLREEESPASNRGKT